jgi:hypothetical protein
MELSRYRPLTTDERDCRISADWVRVTLRLEVYRQSVRLGDKPIETDDTLILFSKWTLEVIVLMYHPLWREDRSVIYNCCWSSPAQSFSSPSPMGLLTILSQIRDSPLNLEGQVPVYIPQEQGTAVIPLGIGFPFRRLLRLAGLRWRYSTPPPLGICASPQLSFL